MGLFPSSKDFKDGPGVEKDTPRKTGVGRFFELVGRDMSGMFLANLLTCIGFLPVICLVYIGFLMNNLTVMIVSAIAGGILAGPALAGVYDTVLRALRDEAGYWWTTYRRAFRQNFKASILPGILYCGHEGHNHETEEHNHDGHDHEGHDHEHEGHNHEHEEQENHAGGSDEIILPPAKAQAAGVAVSTVEPGSFHQVIKTSGQVMAAQGDESVAVATVAGVVSFKGKVIEGMSVSKGTPLVVLSSKNMVNRLNIYTQSHIL